MNELEQELLSQVNDNHNHVVELRRYFHSNPELSTKEFNTQLKIEEELDRIGITEHKRIATTGVYAEIVGKQAGDRTIVLRADTDALPIQEQHDVPYASKTPGVMHACGHDAHTASLLGAAKILFDNRDKFAGKVILTFQPGEEVGYGARIIVDEGYIDEADRTFGVHLASNVPAGKVAITPGPNNASVDQFKILIHAKGVHISTPHLGADAGFVASKIVVDSQTIVPRRINPMENVLLGIGHVEAGTTYNVVPEEAIIEGTLRTFNQDVRKQVLKEFEQLVHNTASQYGATAEFFNKDNTSPLINDPQASSEAIQTAQAIFGKENVVTNRPASLGGDDMAEYILKVPGVYAYIGSGNENVPETVVAHHDCHFDIDEESLRVATALYSIYAIEYLNHIV